MTSTQLSLEQVSVFMLVNGLIGLTGLVSLVFVGIQTFRRRPPAEAQFADSRANAEEHDRLHRRIGDLRDKIETQFVTRELFMAAEAARLADRNDIKEKLDELLQRTAHLVGYGNAGGKN